MVPPHRVGGEKGRDLAFDRIWRIYHKRILFFVRQRAPADAEDLTQEILLKVYRNLGRFDPERSFDTWIYSIARNHCINYFAKRRPVFQPAWAGAEGTAECREPDTPESRLVDDERDQLIDAALSRLDAESREMAYLKYFEGMKTRHIASVFGIAEGTVKSRLHQIRGRIREALRGHAT